MSGAENSALYKKVMEPLPIDRSQRPFHRQILIWEFLLPLGSQNQRTRSVRLLLDKSSVKSTYQHANVFIYLFEEALVRRVDRRGIF